MLSDLAKKGKAYWGYPQAWLELWDQDLTIDLLLLRKSMTYVLINKNQIYGFCLLQPKDGLIEIEHFWLKTSLIGKGIGGQLLTQVLKVSKKNYARIEVSADPHAKGFYEKFGFKYLKEIPSLPKGRTIPRLYLEFE